jgi:hypothetical protein
MRWTAGHFLTGVMLWVLDLHRKDAAMDERSVPRTVADLSVPAALRDRTIHIQLYNLSPLGCMFECAESVDENDAIQITLAEGIRARGRVIWSRETFAGVEFLDRLHPALIELLGFQVPVNQIDPWIAQDRLGRELPPVSAKSRFTVH